MAVAVVSAPADVTSNSVTSKTSTAITVSGSNTALVVAVILQHAASALAVHWDSTGTNQAMTLIGSKSDAGNLITVYLYGLIAPTAGNKTLSATWTTASDVCLASACFSGVDQTGGVTSFAHFNSAAATGTPSLTVTSATGDFVIGVAGNTTGSFNATGNTQWFDDNAPNNFSGMGNYATGAATVTLTGSPSVAYAYAGVDVVAATGGGSFTGSVADTAATSDGFTVTLTIPTVAFGDTAATSDGLTRTFTIPTAALGDSAATSDTVTGQAVASLADSATTSDTLAGVGTATASLGDTAATSDSLTGQGASSASLSDNAATSDSLAGQGRFTASLGDSAATSDSVAGAAIMAAILSDTAATSDAISGAMMAAAILSDSAAASDLASVITGGSFAFNLSDSISSADAFTAVLTASASLSDTAATSDSLSALARMVAALSDALATSDAYAGAMLAAASLSDAATSSDAIGANVMAALSDVIASSDGVTALATLTAVLSDAVATSDIFAFGGAITLFAEQVIPALLAMINRASPLSSFVSVGALHEISSVGVLSETLRIGNA